LDSSLISGLLAEIFLSIKTLLALAVAMSI